MLFLKLGGSLITDKTRDSTPRPDVIGRLAAEIAAHLAAHPEPILIGHGSGSFGHAAAKRHGTRDGVHSADDWRGFAEVSVVAARLNRIVADALYDAGVPVFGVAPSASARCAEGRLVGLDTRPIRAALEHGLVPLIMGDVALDDARGGTIVSTEEVFAYLAGVLPAQRILLAGETDGVYRDTARGAVIARITPRTWAEVQDGVGGSHGVDVTGGMAGKVRDMLSLVAAHPQLKVWIFSGAEGNLACALAGAPIGTLVEADPA